MATGGRVGLRLSPVSPSGTSRPRPADPPPPPAGTPPRAPTGRGPWCAPAPLRSAGGQRGPAPGGPLVSARGAQGTRGGRAGAGPKATGPRPRARDRPPRPTAPDGSPTQAPRRPTRRGPSPSVARGPGTPADAEEETKRRNDPQNETRPRPRVGRWELRSLSEFEIPVRWSQQGPSPGARGAQPSLPWPLTCGSGTRGVESERREGGPRALGPFRASREELRTGPRSLDTQTDRVKSTTLGRSRTSGSPTQQRRLRPVKEFTSDSWTPGNRVNVFIENVSLEWNLEMSRPSIQKKNKLYCSRE